LQFITTGRLEINRGVIFAVSGFLLLHWRFYCSDGGRSAALLSEKPINKRPVRYAKDFWKHSNFFARLKFVGMILAWGSLRLGGGSGGGLDFSRHHSAFQAAIRGRTLLVENCFSRRSAADAGRTTGCAPPGNRNAGTHV